MISKMASSSLAVREVEIDGGDSCRGKNSDSGDAFWPTSISHLNSLTLKS